MRKTGIASLVAVLIAGCAPLQDESESREPAPSPSSTGTTTPSPSSTGTTPSPSSTGTTTTTESLSLTDAPAPTQSFYWGTIDVTAPGFVGPPADALTLSLDNSGALHYLSFKTLPMITKVFGDADDQYPLAGTKYVQTDPGSGAKGYNVTVIDSPAATADHFLLSYHAVDTDTQVDYVESTEGTRSGGGWAITYSQTGTLWAASIDAHANGTIYAGDPSAPAPVPGQPTTWSAPVEVSAPGFVGPPVDHLTVTTDGEGQIQSFAFVKFVVVPHTFGQAAGDFPLSGTVTGTDPVSGGGRTVAVDLSAAPDPNHFALRYHVLGDPQETHLAGVEDYEEGIDGTRVGNALVVRYLIKGTHWGAAIDAHAAGTLVPASPSSP
jgi:hypothetical protein